MAMTKTRMTIVLLAVAVVASACGSSSSATTPASTTQTMTTDTFTGIVPAAVNGAMQSSFNQFVVGQGGGTVTLALTSAIETLPGNTYVANVTMGLGIGTPANGVCTLLSGTSLYQTQPNALSPYGTFAAGTFCVLIQDVTGQLGPVNYSIAVTHP